MSKKKLILSQEQINKICENEDGFTYLKDLATKPDIGDIYSTEITTDGSIENGYPEPITTDDKANTMTTNWRGQSRLNGMGPVMVREMSKKDWKKKYIISEEHEHGNARLKNRTFGAVDGEKGKSYSATKSAVCRKRKAEEDLRTGNDIEKAKAAKTLERMRKNWSGLDVAANQYKTAENVDGVVQKNKMGPKIKSAPKETGNGKAHSPKNGVFLN
jgi:hypothetical protein